MVENVGRIKVASLSNSKISRGKARCLVLRLVMLLLSICGRVALVCIMGKEWS
jgi:hypothetical protein